MATRATNAQARQFGQLIAELEPQIRRAFMASVTDLQSNVDWPRLIERLNARDVEGAIAALNINEAAWATYAQALTQAYATAGASTAAYISASGIGPIGIRFNIANPMAQDWIRRNVGESITGFTEEAIRAAREVIYAGYATGQGSNRIGLDLVGRVEGGARTGGIMGLDVPRAERLNKVVQGMRSAEGVQSLVVRGADGSLSLRYKVNKATADRILKAYRAGEAVPLNERLISERQYSNALLKARSETVANTEVGNAVLSARQNEWQQLIDGQNIDPRLVRKTWKHNRNKKDGRPEHIAMNGVSVIGLDTPFVLPDGSQMLHPHDVNGGAINNINCGCDVSYTLIYRE